MSNLNHVKNLLIRLKPELQQKFYVNSIGLFGSIVRDDFSPESDVDILVDFTRPVGIEFIDLANYIESKLNYKVDLVSKDGIQKQYLPVIESEVIYV